jgi:hypothetical protein
MKNKIYKSIAYLFLVGLLSLNITSTLSFQFGGELAKAFNVPLPITCHSSGVFHLGRRYTDCSTCSPVKRHRGEDPGLCTP